MNNQLILDSKDEKMKKRWECAAKRETRRDNLYTPMRVPVSDSAAPLMFRLKTLISFLSRFGWVFTTGSAAHLSSDILCRYLVFYSLCCLVLYLLYCLMFVLWLPDWPFFSPVSYPGTTTVLLFCPILGPAPTYLTFLAPGTFKCTLSNESWCHYFTILAKSLCLFLTLGQLPVKNECK